MGLFTGFFRDNVELHCQGVRISQFSGAQRERAHTLAATGAPRDTRLPSKPDGSRKPECDTVFAKRSEAIAWVQAHYPNARREGTDEQRADARARIDSAGNAR
jgi:hypothetical protein